jgi:mono/diheme cytochrome c family protein
MVRFLAALGLLLAACVREPPYPRHGEAMYAQYCASCHGATGKGDGPAAALLPAPTDLTKSDLNLAELMKVIDGRRNVCAHGTAANAGVG